MFVSLQPMTYFKVAFNFQMVVKRRVVSTTVSVRAMAAVVLSVYVRPVVYKWVQNSEKQNIM